MKKIEWPKFDRSKVISQEQFEDLRNFANQHGIDLQGFRDFDGQIYAIKDFVVTLSQLRDQFPAVADKRHRLSLAVSYKMDDDDFAMTKGRVITLNGNAFRNIEHLAQEYQKFVDDGWFVQGTSWRAVIHHEFGHVVAHAYHIKSLQIACSITNKSIRQTLTYLKTCLSEYAFAYEDGSEIVSEVFSDISRKTQNDFSLRFYQEILKIISEGR